MKFFSRKFCIASTVFVSLSLLSFPLFAKQTQEKPAITVSSKIFTESHVLAEIIAQVIEQTGEAKVDRRFGLGQTGILYQAIVNGEIDVYPEYTGTIAETILKNPSIKTIPGLRKALDPYGLTVSESLGFNNTFAMGVREADAKNMGLAKISDLAKHPDIRGGFTYEFLKREDGLEKMLQHYGFKLNDISSMDHSLAYEAIAKGKIDLMDLYSTDAKIQKLELRSLIDDKGFFPNYYSVLLVRKDITQKFPKTWAALRSLEGAINEKKMIELNAMAEIDKKSFDEVAATFLNRSQGSRQSHQLVHEIIRRTKEHILLVTIAVLASILIGVPLGVLAIKHHTLRQIILLLSSLVQTIPSLALLCFMIPLFGIGMKPALVALFLYGLLPIVVNTYIGLNSIDPLLTESGRALGLTPFQRFRLVELPLASPSILGGIKTSAIISIGTATLAALIGAGGYGVPIVTGLFLNNIPTILTGAIPAALMAVAAHGVFELFSLLLISKGLRH